MPFNTRNPIPSGDLRDLDDNARNIDTWANDKTKLSHPDRFGVERRTWHGIEQEAQLNIQQAIDAKNAAQEAAMMSGFSKYADTLAQLESGIGTDYVEGDVVLVFQDEDRGGTSSIYKVESGVAVFKNAFDKTRQDLFSFTGNISADAEWSDVPAHSDPAFDVQAQALVNRTEMLMNGVGEYSKIREYAGNGTRLKVQDPTGVHWWVRRGSAADNGGTVLVDAIGRSWEREYSGAAKASWWGVKTNDVDTTAELQAALASGLAIELPSGTIRYSETIGPSTNNQYIFGNFWKTTLKYVGTGWAFSFKNRSQCLFEKFNLSTTGNGIYFGIDAAANCLNNKINLFNIQGANDRSAVFNEATATRGILFDSMSLDDQWAVFFNVATNGRIRGFDINVEFGARSGMPTHGGNANECHDITMERYWIGYRFSSIENRVTGGFFNQSPGDSSRNTIAYHFTNGCSGNVVYPAVGEPGQYTVGYVLDEGTSNNYIDRGMYQNWSHGNLDNSRGRNSVTNFAHAYSSTLTTRVNERELVRYKLSTIGNNSASNITLKWRGVNSATAAQSAGEVSFSIRRGTSSPVLNIHYSNSIIGLAAGGRLAGFVIESNDIYVVFHGGNNGTSSNTQIAVSTLGSSTCSVDPIGEVYTGPLTIEIPSQSGTVIYGNVGFNGANPIPKPNVTGAKGGNAALTSLIAALVNMGLIDDQTT